ncbi:MAG: hypothetical protein IM638_03290 [Bacteroidetes bacterium]|nr:hypothetical protein [Bacteroidota bacterium]
MQVLQQIIGSMNKEEVRHLKLYMSRTNASDDRKDIELFDYIRHNHENYEESRIQQKLYKGKDKNALYRLKNRLLDDVGRSLALQYLDENEFGQVVHLLTLARLFVGRTQPAVALHYLQRAERKALALDSLELLDLVYGEYIRFSQETPEQNPAEYIRRRRQNREQLNKLQEIDDILAEVVYNVRISQGFSKQNYRMIDTLRKKATAFSRSKAGRTSTQLRFKVYHSLSRVLLQKNDFVSLEKYLQQTVEEFTTAKLYNRNNHDTKLQQLTYLANAQYKNKKYDESLATAAQLQTAMKEYGGLLHDKFLMYYYNILVINYSVKDRDKAIAILNEAKESAVIKKLPFYLVFIYFNLSVLHFDKADYKTALRHLTRLKMEQGYPTLDEQLRMKIEVAELIIRFELEDFDFLERRMAQIRKDFASLMNTRSGKRQQELMNIITAMMKLQGSVRRDKPLQRSIQKFIDAAKRSPEEDVINYTIWLQSRLA